jgi:hypothetical protein
MERFSMQNDPIFLCSLIDCSLESNCAIFSLMTISSGDDIHIVLSDLVEWAHNNPEEEAIVKRALGALRQELRNSAAIVEIASEHSPEIDINIHYGLQSRKDVQSEERDKMSLIFGEELRIMLGMPNLRHKDLIKMAEEVGGKHGLFPNQTEKRSKSGLLNWVKSKMDVLEADMREYVNQHYKTV